jgi:hypothetical protein
MHTVNQCFTFRNPLTRARASAACPTAVRASGRRMGPEAKPGRSGSGKRLGASSHLLEPIEEKPRGMQWKTFGRLGGRDLIAGYDGALALRTAQLWDDPRC